MAIRWKDSEKKEIQRLVKNYNAKINRIAKNSDVMSEFLPTKKNTKDIINNISSRQDLNRQIKSLERFTKRGAEKIVQFGDIFTTQYEKKEYQLAQKNINIKRTYEKKRLENKGVTLAKDEETLFKKKQKEPTTQRDFKKFLQQAAKEMQSDFYVKRYEKYKENYIKSLDFLGVNKEEIKKIIENFSGEQLYELSQKEEVLNIQFLYDPIDQDLKAELMLETLENIDNTEMF